MVNDLDAMLGKDFDVREMARSADVPLRATRNGYELDMPDEDIAEEMPPMDVEPTAQPEQESADPFEVLGQVGTTVYDLPNMAIRGILRAGGEAAYSAGVIDETQANTWRKMLDLSGKMAEDEGVFPIARGLGEGLTQFGAGMFPPFKAMRAMGVSRPVAALISEGLSGAFGFNPDDPNVGNFINSFEGRPEWLKAIGDFIETDPNDTAAENRFRNMLQDVVPSAFIEGLVKIVSKVRNMDADTLIEAGGEAEQRLDSMMSGTTLSANPVGAAGDAMIAGAGKVAEAMKPMEPAPVFYSAVANAVDALPMEKGNASQMRAMIAKSAEVKPEEMAWIGLDDFLKGKKSVTKQEIKEFVDANQVRIEEVIKGTAPDKGKTSRAFQLQNQTGTDLVRAAVRSGYPELEATGLPIQIQQGAILARELPEELQPFALRHFSAYDEYAEMKFAGRETTTKFSDYTLPGGENYREVLLRLPERQLDARYDEALTDFVDRATVKAKSDLIDQGVDVETAQRTSEAMFAPNQDRTHFASAAKYIGEEDKFRFRVLQLKELDQASSGRQNFTGGHYDEPNVLAHMRLNDRTGPNGEKILFVEEIQSDWHQKGRKQGYSTKQTAKSDAEVKALIAEKDAIVERAARDPSTGGMTIRLEDIDRYDDLISQIEPRLPISNTVPNAPLKKTWHEMSFRRIARMAAEEGYDAIAWTPGKLQIDRYEETLRRNVDEITYEPNGDGTFNMAADKNGKQVYDSEGMSIEEVEEVFGKDIAEKVKNDVGADDLDRPLRPDQRSLRGDDLSIGGEGMKGFYDKMLKGYASKWGKKFGAKVGVTNLEVVDTPSDNFVVIDGVAVARDFDTRAEAEAFARKENAKLEGTQVWTLPVTKKMRDSVLRKGVATFGAAGVAAGVNNEARPNGD